MNLRDMTRRWSPTNAGRSSQRLQRVGGWSGFGVAALLVADLFTLSTSPPVGAPAADIVVHLQANRTVALAMSYLGALTAVLFVPFLASLRTFVEGEQADAQWRWTNTLLCGAAAVAVILIGSALRGAAAVLAAGDVDGAAPVASYTGGKVALSFALVPIGALLLTNARTMSSASTPIRWLVRFGTQIGLLGVLVGPFIFVNNRWLGPGESIVAFVGLCVSLWLLAISVAILDPESVSK